MSARAPLRIAAVQCTAAPADVAGNAVEHGRWIGEAATGGAQVVLFPELSVTGYEPDLIDLHGLSVSPDDTRLDPIRRACRDHGVRALIGAPVPGDDGGIPRIAVLLADPAGRISEVYAKRFLDPSETGIFSAGSGDTVLDVAGWRLALAVCYEASLPEHARGLARLGADAYLVSALYRLGAWDRMEAQLKAAAAEGLWAIVAQYSGATGIGPACGGSGAWAPGGREIARLGTSPGLVYADLTGPVG